MNKKITMLVLALLVILSTGCTNSDTQSSEPIKAEWITVRVAGDIVSIPVSEVGNNKMVHFESGTLGGDMAFMVYKVAGKIDVRANACPPCGSVGFSLQRDILVCDTCKTTFNAKTGDGIEGACVDFPKASVPHEIKENSIVMKSDDLEAAYQSTLNPGWP